MKLTSDGEEGSADGVAGGVLRLARVLAFVLDKHLGDIFRSVSKPHFLQLLEIRTRAHLVDLEQAHAVLVDDGVVTARAILVFRPILH